MQTIDYSTGKPPEIYVRFTFYENVILEVIEPDVMPNVGDQISIGDKYYAIQSSTFTYYEFTILIDYFIEDVYEDQRRKFESPEYRSRGRNGLDTSQSKPNRRGLGPIPLRLLSEVPDSISPSTPEVLRGD